MSAIDTEEKKASLKRLVNLVCPHPDYAYVLGRVINGEALSDIDQDDKDKDLYYAAWWLHTFLEAFSPKNQEVQQSLEIIAERLRTYFDLSQSS